MRRFSCFCYREGEHFSLPPALASAPRMPSLFAEADEAGGIRPDSRIFTETVSPETAEVFLFPWAIGQYIDAGRHEDIWRVVAALPYFQGREPRHILWDDGDFTRVPPFWASLFKISVTGAIAERCIAAPYSLPEHTRAETPSFDWDAIAYDTSFVGNVTNVLRKAVVASVRQQAPKLRLLADFGDAFVVRDGYFFNTRESADKAESLRRQELYRESLRKSLTVLCPPGVGPYSFRMYETMYMGRIPVLFEDSAVYPFEKLVDYSKFCIRIPKSDVMDTGMILQRTLRDTPLDVLHRMGVLACKTWHKFFAPDKALPLLAEEARQRFWERPPS